MTLNDTMDFLISVSHYEKTGGFFKITNGKVEDVDGFWGVGNLPLESDFKEQLEKAANFTKNWPKRWSEIEFLKKVIKF